MADRRRAWLIAGLVVLAALVVFFATRPSSGPTVTPSPSVLPSSSASAGASGSPSPSASPSTGGASPSTPGNPSLPPVPTASPAPTPPPGSDVAGTWTGTWANTSPDTSSGALTLVLEQAGPDLTGTLRMDDSICVTEQVLSGTNVDGRIALQNSLRDEVELEGALTGSTMSGTFSMSCDNASGTWSVSRG